MRDLAGSSEYMEPDMHNEVLDAVSDAVKRCVRGSFRSRARGMMIYNERDQNRTVTVTTVSGIRLCVCKTERRVDT